MKITHEEFERLLTTAQESERRPLCIYRHADGSVRSTHYADRIADRQIIGLYDAAVTARMLRDDLQHVGAL